MTRIYVSNDTSAKAAGADRLAKAWENRPGVATVRTSSRGAFFLEPMAERDTPRGRLAWPRARPEDLDRILAGEGGTPVAQIPFLARQTRVTFANFGVTRPLSPEDYVAHGGGAGLDRARGLSPDGILDELKRSQLRGRGGAAFPVWAKWKIAKETPSDRKYVVANADEGDAGTYCDRMLMEGEPFRLIEGMLICALAIGAQRGYIYCRQEYPAAARALQTAIAEAEQSGMLDCRGATFKLEVFVGAGSYVCGEETALLESLEGRRGVVRAKPPYPAVAGLYGCPTIVSNVLTFATVPAILAKGGDWYASMGTERSRGTIPLQIGGRVRQPGLVEIPFGATLGDVLDRFGGGMAPGATLKAVQVGGPLGSLFPASKLDIPVCYDAFAAAGAILGHGGIVVFDDETDMVELARHFMAFTADLGETMKTASLCALGARAPYPVLTAIEHFPKEFRREARG
jgi:formate dehydrogenase iron-sulfur subunit